MVLPILREFRPNLLLVSSGFDAAQGDVQGGMCMTPKGALLSSVRYSASTAEALWHPRLHCAHVEALVRYAC